MLQPDFGSLLAQRASDSSISKDIVHLENLSSPGFNPFQPSAGLLEYSNRHHGATAPSLSEWGRGDGTN